MYSNTFSPIQIGPLKLKNRLVMAPLTRQVAELDGTPTDEMAAYYARRARGGIGLIISEGTSGLKYLHSFLLCTIDHKASLCFQLPSNTAIKPLSGLSSPAIMSK